MKQKFVYEIKKIVNQDRAYPINDLGKLFLELNQSRNAKTFTPYQLKIIEKIGDILDFELILIE